MRLVAILPLDIETRTRAEIHLHRLRVCHNFKYRTGRRTAPLAQNLVKPRTNQISLNSLIPFQIYFSEFEVFTPLNLSYLY